MRAQIKRVSDISCALHDTRKVWHQLPREGVVIAKCCVGRLSERDDLLLAEFGHAQWME